MPAVAVPVLHMSMAANATRARASSPLPVLVVRQDTHVGSLWLTKLLEAQRLSAFFQFDGDCHGRAASVDPGPARRPLAPRSPRTLFAEGCRCQSARDASDDRLRFEHAHKEAAFCSGRCAYAQAPPPAACPAVVAMADLARARSILRELRPTLLPRVVLLRRDNVAKRAVSSLKGDCCKSRPRWLRALLAQARTHVRLWSRRGLQPEQPRESQ